MDIDRKKAIESIIQGDSCFMVMLTASDLKSIVESMCKNYECAQQEQATMTRQDVSRTLNVTLATLWRWAKIGYLTPVKVGTKVLYRVSDINALLTKKMGANGSI